MGDLGEQIRDAARQVAEFVRTVALLAVLAFIRTVVPAIRIAIILAWIASIVAATVATHELYRAITGDMFRAVLSSIVFLGVVVLAPTGNSWGAYIIAAAIGFGIALAAQWSRGVTVLEMAWILGIPAGAAVALVVNIQNAKIVSEEGRDANESDQGTLGNN